MRTFLRVAAAFVLGAVLTCAIVVAILFWYAHVNGVIDRDGGMSMAIVFVIGPFARRHRLRHCRAGLARPARSRARR